MDFSTRHFCSLGYLNEGAHVSKLSLGTILITLSGITAAIAGLGFRAPEIDPASALAAMTLLLGGLTVIRGRKSKK
jgi:heme/copper-type cytochrome/quinol oxidase subunit 3